MGRAARGAGQLRRNDGFESFGLHKVQYAHGGKHRGKSILLEIHAFHGTPPRGVKSYLAMHELEDLVHDVLGWNLEGLSPADAQLNLAFLEGTAQDCHKWHA